MMGIQMAGIVSPETRICILESHRLREQKKSGIGKDYYK